MNVSQEFKDAVLLGARMRLDNATHKEIVDKTKLTYGRAAQYFYGGNIPAGFKKIFTDEEMNLIKEANKHTKQFSVS